MLPPDHFNSEDAARDTWFHRYRYCQDDERDADCEHEGKVVTSNHLDVSFNVQPTTTRDASAAPRVKF
jgi:hypothetical protein